MVRCFPSGESAVVRAGGPSHSPGLLLILPGTPTHLILCLCVLAALTTEVIVFIYLFVVL